MNEETNVSTDGKFSRADLHVHSRHSDRPSEWFLRRIGAPESFVDPGSLYDSCRQAGMDYVTITDHNSILGALEIADRPGVFISSEITTYFPEDKCKIHCLVHGVTEKWFDEIQKLRENIYELRDFMVKNDIIHSIAHPLFSVNDKLTADHFEKLLVLFNRFEVLNGTRDARAGCLARVILENLTPDLLNNLADKHGISPAGDLPWRKILTGGSDDHSGLYTASAYSQTPYARTVFDFLQHLRDGDVAPMGCAGNSVRLAHSLYKIAYSYYTSCFTRKNEDRNHLIEALLARLAGQNEKVEEIGVVARTRKRFRKIVNKYRQSDRSDLEKSILAEASGIFANSDSSNGRPEILQHPDADDDKERFHKVCRLTQQLSFNLVQKFLTNVQHGHVLESLQSIFSLGPILLGISPYLTAFAAQHKDNRLLESLAGRFDATRQMQTKTGKLAWISDTHGEVNGVARTISVMASLAKKRNLPLTVLTCSDITQETDYDIHNFKPVGTYPLPEYESINLFLPPFLEIVAYIEENGFDELIISTPGPLGCCGLLAAKLLGLRKVGIYHTDFPKYIVDLTDDDGLEDVTWKYLRWFYGGMDHIYLPSDYYKNDLAEHGFDPDRMSILSKGVDRELFHPGRKNPDMWSAYGINGGFKFIYVGRVSKEKNIESLLKAYSGANGRLTGSSLIIVGDGPAMDELKSRYSRPDIVFTGYLKGEKLAEAYASSDVFVFPSMTDTYGNAVLEAHACGLPAIVAGRGGPPEIVRPYNSGLIVDDAYDTASLGEAMVKIMEDASLRNKLQKGALTKAENSTWDVALESLAKIKERSTI